MISESDWKKFKKIKESALERFCGGAMDECQEVLANRDASNHARYLYLYKLVVNYDKRIASLFNDHSRSKAMIQLMLLRQEGLVTNDELETLSEEFRKSTEPSNHA
ncbi:MAG TPA: hypothetical protein VFA48_03130 [Gammaproteobacteria bacterium]|nr:hypothetical protein [Gammaproteobacteria bacterium]